ncbi:MAG: transketolase C-terminal domain-containing protein, partial [Nanoarchaeota archaeon]
IYKNNETFSVGDFKILKQSKKDEAILIGSGITTHEALKAYEKLKTQNQNVAVIDLYCIKPFNYNKLINFAKKHGNKIIIAEDHYPEGGIGEMIAEGLSGTNIKIKHLAIKEIPHSGKSEELLKKYEIDSDAYVKSLK